MINVYRLNPFVAPPPEGGFNFQVIDKTLLVQELECFYLSREEPPDPYWIRDEEGVRRREVSLPVWVRTPSFRGTWEEVIKFTEQNPYREGRGRSYERFYRIGGAYVVETYVQSDFSYPYSDTYRGTVISSFQKFDFRYAEGAIGPICDAEAFEDVGALRARREREKVFFQSIRELVEFQRLEASYPSGSHSACFER